MRVRANAGGQLAGARAYVLVGGLLPMAFARAWLRGRLDLFETFEDQSPYTIACRRMGRRRIDCGLVQDTRCTAVACIRLALDGVLSAVTYDGGRGRTCRIRRTPDLGDARRRGPS